MLTELAALPAQARCDTCCRWQTEAAAAVPDQNPARTQTWAARTHLPIGELDALISLHGC